MSYIIAIETAVPKHCHKQDDIVSFFQNSTDDEKIKRKIKIVFEKSGIKSRYSVLKDFSLTPKDFNFFSKNAALLPEPSLTRRMNAFKDNAVDLSAAAVMKIKNFSAIKKSITHIITVTCTGLTAPGLDIDLIRKLKLNPQTQRSSINFMGCNAAILALNSANSICNSNPNATVLIVCTELCTIHFQKNHSDDYILSTALFGDGSAAVLVSSKPPQKKYMQGLKIKSFNSLLVHKGYKDMAWQLSETGFIMNLTSYVSELINGNMKHLLSAQSIKPSEINHWAIHPGGKKIIDDFIKTFDLKKENLNESYDVLKKHGNMSSPTVLFVLKQIIENNKSPKKGNTIFAAAFGPGLSIETMQLQYV